MYAYLNAWCRYVRSPISASLIGYLQLAGHASIFACTGKKMMVVHLLHWPNHIYLQEASREVERITNNVHAVQQDSGQQQTIASEALDYIQAPSIRLLRLRSVLSPTSVRSAVSNAGSGRARANTILRACTTTCSSSLMIYIYTHAINVTFIVEVSHQASS